jgi:hypothetical protein
LAVATIYRDRESLASEVAMEQGELPGQVEPDAIRV